MKNKNDKKNTIIWQSIIYTNYIDQTILASRNTDIPLHTFDLIMIIEIIEMEFLINKSINTGAPFRNQFESHFF